MLTNIVLMGMGEPLYNYDNVVAAMNRDGPGGWRSRRIHCRPPAWCDDRPLRRELGVNLAFLCTPWPTGCATASCR
jgi:adenine C2-methylase RlmN of 23S rRNA A2503 and tRNA A37